jgi:hypothetical protein
MEAFMVCMSKKNDKNEIQIDTILSCHANHVLSTIQMIPNVSIRPAPEVDPQQKTSRGRTALAVAKDRWLGGDPWGLGNRWNRSQIWFRDDILQVVPM